MQHAENNLRLCAGVQFSELLKKGLDVFVCRYSWARIILAA